MFVMFQAVFAWAERPMALIEEAIGALQAGIAQVMPAGFVQSLLADGVLAGVGSVVVFLPQILILFFFILLLEQSGYMVRARSEAHTSELPSLMRIPYAVHCVKKPNHNQLTKSPHLL